MKINISAAITCLLLFCSTISLAEMTTIKGLVKGKRMNEIRVGLYTDPIQVVPVNYTTKVKNDGSFSISFQLSTFTLGFIEIDGHVFNLYVSPGKNINIVFKNGLIACSGTLRNENKFLFDIRNKQLNYNDYNLKLSPDSNYIQMKQRQNKLRAYLYTRSSISKLSPNFISLYNAEDICRFNLFLINFCLEYAFEHHLFITDKIFESHYNHPINYYANDDYIKAPSYISTIFKYVTISTEVLRIERIQNLTYNQAINRVFIGNLSGKTRAYVMAYEIFIDLRLKNKPDTVLIENFRKVAKDNYASETVENIITNYKFNIGHLGKQLSEHVKNTMLTDTNGKEITLGDLIAKYPGKALYFDVYGYYCPGCRTEMPFEQVLEKEYADKPLEFIYLTPDSDKDFNPGWTKYFTVSGTKQNQYRIINGYKAELLKEFNFFGIPQYFIIDKEGRLLAYNAPRPSSADIKPLLDKAIN